MRDLGLQCFYLMSLTALSVLFVFAGKIGSDDVYILGIFIEVIIVVAFDMKIDRLERKIKKLKKAYGNSIDCLTNDVRSTEQE